MYVYVCKAILCWCAAGRNVQPIAIKFGTKFSLDVNKNWIDFGDFSPKGVEMVGGWNLKKLITMLIWMLPVWLQMGNILLINLYNLCEKFFDRSSLKGFEYRGIILRPHFLTIF